MPSWAQRQFDIEVIIFKRALNPEQTAESWPDSLPELSMDNVGYLNDTIIVIEKGHSFTGFLIQTDSSSEEIKKSCWLWEVLTHMAWRQGDGNRYRAPTFRIKAGRDFSGQFNSDGSPKGTNTGTEVIDGVTEENISRPLYELDGKLQIYVEHYLYADVQLDLKQSTTREVKLEDNPLVFTEISNLEGDDTVQAGMMENITPTIHTEQFLKSYRMDQKRRMRSTETHFLDHPLLGVIIQVRRVPE